MRTKKKNNTYTFNTMGYHEGRQQQLKQEIIRQIMMSSCRLVDIRKYAIKTETRFSGWRSETKVIIIYSLFEQFIHLDSTCSDSRYLKAQQVGRWCRGLFLGSSCEYLLKRFALFLSLHALEKLLTVHLDHTDQIYAHCTISLYMLL